MSSVEDALAEFSLSAGDVGDADGGKVSMEGEEKGFDESTQLWKTWDDAADKSGARHTVYWVRHNPKVDEARRLGLKAPALKFVTGERYTGEWAHNMRDGFGTQVWVDGNKYEGEWKENMRHGKGAFWVRVGRKLRKQYTGDWRRNMRHGLGIFFYDNGDKYEGEWRHNRRYGRGKHMFSNGDVYEGDWIEDKRNGLGVLTLSNGDRYEGQWMDDKKDGPGRFFYKDTAKVYQGEWVADVAKCGVYCDIAPSDSPFLGDEGLDRFDLPPLGLEDAAAVLTEAVARIRATREGGPDWVDAPDGFTEEEIDRLRKVFDAEDGGGSGAIIGSDLQTCLAAVGYELTEDETTDVLMELDADVTTALSFEDFLRVYASFRGAGPPAE